MKPQILDIKALLSEAVANIVSEQAYEDRIEDQIISLLSPPIDEEIQSDDEQSRESILSLADIPIREWREIQVSPDSKFGQNTWDFTSYPGHSPKGKKVNFDYTSNIGINVTSPEFHNWLMIAKVLCFYSVPHFSVSSWIKAYTSLSSRKAKCTRLFALFLEHNLYLGEIDSPKYRTLNDISREEIIGFIERQTTPSKRWEISFIIQFWQKLSSSGLLPHWCSLHTHLLTKDDVSKYRNEFDACAKPYDPIPIDDYANIIQHCLLMVDDYSRDIIWLYHTYYPTVVGAFEHDDRRNLRPEGVSCGSSAGVSAFRSYRPKLSGNEPWWPLEIKNAVSDGREFIDAHKINSLIASLIDACCTLILATTGLRRSEVSSLKVDCLSRNSEGSFLRYTVFKTSEASQGDEKMIPIPAPTVRAIELMVRFFKEAREFGGHDSLFSVVTRHHFGNPVNSAYPERAVKRVAAAADVSENIFPHRFRKTLAMYLIYQDPENIDLIRHLFSHKSLKMTLKYILSLPGIHSEVRKIAIDQNVDLLAEVIASSLEGKIGGIGGKRVQATLDKSNVLIAKLQDDGKETLTQYVDSLLDQGIQILHRTNLAICLRTPTMSDYSPCIGKNEPASSKLHPNLFACDPFNCKFAAFLESNIPALESEIIFHDRLSRSRFCSEHQRSFSENRIDQAFTRYKEINPRRASKFMKLTKDG